MSSQVTPSEGYSRVPKWLRQVTFLVLVVIFIAGVVTVFERYGELRHIAAESYHPYLIKNGLSDDFYVFYFLILESLMALSFAIAATIIALHKPVTWITLFAAVALMMFGASVPPPLHALVVIEDPLSLPLRFMRAIGLCLFIIFFYIFPNGRFVLRWTRLTTIVLVVWSLIWPFYSPLNPYKLPGILPFLVLLCWFGTGVFAQIQRYLRVSNPVQQQQTKWVVFGLTVAFLGDFISHVAWYIFPSLHTGPDLIPVLIHHPLFVFTQLFLPVSIGVSIFRYGLWEINFIINRTLVFGLFMTVLAASWEAVVKLLEKIFKHILGEEAEPIAAALGVLVVGIGFGTTREKLQHIADHYFFPKKADFSNNLSEFLPEALATMHNLSDLLQVLVNRTVEITHVTHGAVFLCDGHVKLQTAVCNITPIATEAFDLSDSLLKNMRKGKVTARPEDSTFPLVVPLTLARGKDLQLIGVLALGSRFDGRGYSHEELSSFKTLGSQAGTAIYIARINMENQNQLKNQINSLEDNIEVIKAQLARFNGQIPE